MDYMYELGKLEGCLTSYDCKKFILHFLVREFLISFNDEMTFEDFFENVIVGEDNSKVILKLISIFNESLKEKNIDEKFFVKIYKKMTNLEIEFNESIIANCMESENVIQKIYNVYKYFVDKDGLAFATQFARLCLLIMLVKFGVLSFPIIDLSFAFASFGKCKNFNDFQQILSLASESAIKLINTAKKVINSDMIKLRELNVKSAYNVFDYACTNLVIDIGGTAKQLDYTFVTVNKTLTHLVELQVLKKKSGNMRYRTYKYAKLLKVFELQ